MLAEESRITEIEWEIERCYEEQRGAYEDFRMERLGRETYLKKKARLEAREEELRHRLSDQQKALEEAEEAGHSGNNILSDIMTGNEGIEIDTLTADLVGKLIDKITVWPDGKMEIAWTFRQ